MDARCAFFYCPPLRLAFARSAPFGSCQRGAQSSSSSVTRVLTALPLQFPTCSRCRKRRDECTYGEGVFVYVSPSSLLPAHSLPVSCLTARRLSRDPIRLVSENSRRRLVRNSHLLIAERTLLTSLLSSFPRTSPASRECVYDFPANHDWIHYLFYRRDVWTSHLHQYCSDRHLPPLQQRDSHDGGVPVRRASRRRGSQSSRR